MRRQEGFLAGLLVGVLMVGRCHVSAYPQYEDTEANDKDVVDFDDSYDSEDVPTAVTASGNTFRQRIRRFGEQNRVGSALRADEARDVEGAIKDMLAGRQLDHLTASLASDKETDETDPYDVSTRTLPYTDLTSISQIDPTKLYEEIIDEIIDDAQEQGLILKEDKQVSDGSDSKDSIAARNLSRSAMPQRTSAMTTTKRMQDDEMGRQDGKSDADAVEGASDKPETQFPLDNITEDKTQQTNLITTAIVTTTGWILPPILTRSTPVDLMRQGTFDTASNQTSLIDDASNGTEYTETTERTVSKSKSRRRKSSTRKSSSSTAPEADFDIPALVDIIANLTSEFESNLTNLFNDTLQRYNIPTCKTPAPSTTELVHYDLMNATVVAKCFVCGLVEPGIPEHAHCADAFAGDFLPLVPVDPQARGHIARFRKYCRYMDVNGYYENSTQPRSVYGRFTGGCSVRWVDLTGVYTQRACRNTRHTMMGAHFASKRMAKLEMALKDVDNGCIISPMASLLPLSRGISLYARFHACVCTGSWCNTSQNPQWIACLTILSVFGVNLM